MPSSSVHRSAPPKPSPSSVSRHHDGNGDRIVGPDGRVLVYRDATFMATPMSTSSTDRSSTGRGRRPLLHHRRQREGSGGLRVVRLSSEKSGVLPKVTAASQTDS